MLREVVEQAAEDFAGTDLHYVAIDFEKIVFHPHHQRIDVGIGEDGVRSPAEDDQRNIFFLREFPCLLHILARFDLRVVPCFAADAHRCLGADGDLILDG